MVMMSDYEVMTLSWITIVVGLGFGFWLGWVMRYAFIKSEHRKRHGVK